MERLVGGMYIFNSIFSSIDCVIDVVGFIGDNSFVDLVFNELVFFF